MVFSSILILIIAFLSLIALMIIHEFGHFIIAKKFGVRVENLASDIRQEFLAKKLERQSIL